MLIFHSNQTSRMYQSFKLLSIITSILVLAGCASGPAQVMKDTPDVVNTSDKSAENVASCLDKSWEDVRVLGGSVFVDVKKTDAGIRLTSRYGDVIHHIALVTSRTGGSRTQYWSQMVMGSSPENKAVAACQ